MADVIRRAMDAGPGMVLTVVLALRDQSRGFQRLALDGGVLGQMMAAVPLLAKAEREGGVWVLPQDGGGAAELRSHPLHTLLQVLRDLPVEAEDLNRALFDKCNVPKLLDGIGGDTGVESNTRTLALRVRGKLKSMYEEAERMARSY